MMVASVRDIQNLDTTVVGLQGNPVSNVAPTLGQVLTWNGSVWVPQAIPPQPPVPPVPPLPGPIIGVTDGSDAAPGMVGEFRLNSPSTINQVSGVNATLGIWPLPPGDWDVFSYVAGGFGGNNVTEVDLTINVNGSWATTMTTVSGPQTIGWFGWPIRYFRISGSSGLSYEIQFNSTFTGGALPGQIFASGSYWARRAR